MRGWSWKRWLVIGSITAVVAVVGGPFVYIHLIEGKAPAPLALSTSPVSASASEGSSGTGGMGDRVWKATSSSIVGYRVKEVLFGQSQEAVGRTNAITGSITIEGTTIAAASFVVDMTTVTSDESRRDEQFNGRIMETGTYPTASFTLTEPIELGSIPAAGAERTLQAQGDLTLHGVTRSVTFQVTGVVKGSAVQIAGSISITFADWDIANPSFGPITTEDHGILEFAIDFTHS